MTPHPAPADTVSLYVRLSKEAGDTNLSKGGMLADLRALAEREGLRIVAEHIDDGLSGAKRDRPAWRAWIADATEGRASVLASWHTDRITREGVNAAALLLDAVEGKDATTGAVVRPPVRLIDTKGLDSVGNDDSWRFQFVIGAEVARAERRRMVDRSLARSARIRERGGYLGGAAPFGFRRTRDADGTSVLEIEPAEAELLRLAARRVIAGDNLGAVSRYMTSVLPPRQRANGKGAASWTRVTTRRVLTNSSVTARILTRPEAAALAAALEPKGPAPVVTRSTSRLLSGLLVCCSCGTRLSAWHGSAGQTSVYRCQSKSLGRDCAAPVAVSMTAVDAWISAEYLSRYAHLTADFGRVVVEVDVEGLPEAEAEVERLGALALSLKGAARAEALDALEAAEADVERLSAMPPERVTVIPASGDTFGTLWEAAASDAARQRMLAASLVAPLVVGPGRRGPRGFDPARLVAPPRWDLDDADAWLDDPEATA